MASWTSPTVHATGDTLSVSDWNNLANDAIFLYQAPYGFYYNSVATSLPNNTVTQVTLGGIEASNYGFAISSNNAVVPLAGVYAVSFSSQPASSSGVVLTEMWHNGSNAAAGSSSPAQGATSGGLSAGSTVLKCAASDTLGLYGFQNSGSTVSTTNNSAATYLRAFFVGSQ